MKHLFGLIFLFCSVAGLGQVNIVVTPGDTTVCFRDSIAFTAEVSGSGTSAVTFQWQKNFIDITGATDTVYAISRVDVVDPGLYRCILFLDGASADTSNDVTLGMHPRMFIDTLYRFNSLGCPEDCKGQFKTQISGGTPFAADPHYIFEWNGGYSQDTIVFGLCRGLYNFMVTDSMGCHLDSSYYVDVLKLPKVTFDIQPDSVVYLTNPNIEVSFPDSITSRIVNWTWDFGDSVKVANQNPAAHAYTRAGEFKIKLSFTDLNGCDSTVTNEVTVKVAKLKIPNMFSPNGDLINDKFAIELEDDNKRDFREAYLSNELLVFDRWGRKVFNATDYKSEDWDGARISDGTYFYILKLTGQYGDEVQKGSVAILRGK